MQSILFDNLKIARPVVNIALHEKTNKSCALSKHFLIQQFFLPNEQSKNKMILGVLVRETEADDTFFC